MNPTPSLEEQIMDGHLRIKYLKCKEFIADYEELQRIRARRKNTILELQERLKSEGIEATASEISAAMTKIIEVK